MTVRQIEETLGIQKATVDRIMREHLGLRKHSARWVPKLFTPDQKALRRKFVTMDETWAYHFTPESKKQSMQWRHSGSPPPKKAKTVPSAGKVMVSVFWDSEGVLLLDFLNKGQTITGNYYAYLVKQLRDAFKEKRRGKLSKKIVYHQNNAPSHRSLQAMAAIYDSGFEPLPHLAPYDFHLFLHLKKSLSGIHFRSDEEVIDAVTSFFESLETSFFLEGIKTLEHRCKKSPQSNLGCHESQDKNYVGSAKTLIYFLKSKLLKKPNKWLSHSATIREVRKDKLNTAEKTLNHGCCDLHFRRLTPGFHRRAKAKISLEDDDLPIDDTKTMPLFTPQEKGRKGTRDKVPRLRWIPCQKHVRLIREFSPLASGGMSLEATNLVWAGSPHRAEHEPSRLGSESEAVADLSAENHFQGEDSRMADASANYANLPIDRSHANFAAACIADVTPSTSGALAAATNWAEQMKAAESGEDSFTVVKHKRRRRESPNRPVEQRSSGVAASRRTGATPRRRPTEGGATVVQEIRATRADIADARVQQRSSTEDNCVFVEHCPDFGYTHYLQAVEELVGGAGNVLQVMKMDGHMLVGLSTKALAERLLRDGLEIGHTHLRAFPFKKRAERITVANLPFFVDDAAVIEALKPFGDVSSIAPIRLRAGRYTFTDGRREAFILLKEGFTLEKIPTRVVIRNKGNVLSAFISYGVKCSRCGRQGHCRANCPINPGRASNNGQPQPAPLPPGASSTVSRQQSRPTPAAPALPMEETPSAPPPVTPAPPLQAPEGPVGPRPAGSQHPEPPPARPDLVAPLGPLPAQKTLGPAAPTPDVEMSIVEETFASSTSSAKNATRVDLDAFIEGHPSVSFAETDALGLGREEVLDLLSSRTKAQRKGPLLSPPQCDALAGLIRQILDLSPGAASNLYKVLGQVKAELRTTPTAVSPTPPLPAPRPAEPTPPAPHGKMTTPALATSPLFQVEEDLTSKRWDEAADIIYKLCNERYSGPLTDLGITEGDITDAVIHPEDREPLLRTCSTQKKNLITEIISAAIERARDSDPFVREGLYALRRMLLP
ncbi:hypothetical protein LAZ67_22000679 [Cordylochernes scorpioides]|uniref:CCHC-type domain-containing protein n=1 Tax=Cordylochernes scorpioides TaxID=51811 RepID=A0ABY6LQX4_9ARAC|nr:hypothetical protein LAZ67_22000679 [Cordylochernes scorpioides]